MANRNLGPWRGGTLTGGGSSGSGSLFELHRQVNRLFDELFDPRGEAGLPSAASFTAPALDLNHDEQQIEITAELPGVKQEDIDITIEDGVLTLSGEKKSERQDQNGYSERSYGRFERRITLPSDADDERCSADFRDGVLRITIPRSEAKTRGRRIPLAAGRQSGGSIEAQNDSESPPRQEAAQESDANERQDAQQS